MKKWIEFEKNLISSNLRGFAAAESISIAYSCLAEMHRP